MIKKIVYTPILIINMIVALMMLFTGYSYVIHPADYPILALSGLTFPIFLFITLAFMVFWVFVKKRYCAVSFVALLLGYSPVSKYCPLHFEDEEEGNLKIVSWNVHGFVNPDVIDENTEDSVMAFLKRQNPDIVCFQEAVLNDNRREKFGELYPYSDSFEKDKGSALICLSRFPIEKLEPIEYESVGNCSACFYIKTKKGTIRVINNHLQSIGFTHEDKEDFRMIMENGMEYDESKTESKRLFKTIAEGMKKRAPQAEAVAKVVGKVAKMTILVGDFNDTPISYTHHCIEELLVDCYAKAGCMPGFSYRENHMYVRIDHAFCSKDFDVKRCAIDDSKKFSDHYPLVLNLAY